ncbi:anhydro-N-acetylmuramic acid kinase [Flavobacterium pallidum]|uniref:Anhydro-N-acetylmuramic acid kinase n=1 Tax=Flavobacterium pallidum TaxID=2172098 RepID=A0A2S1SGP5_9FLAO|nr:anhydro-N-acetylmuramic acid kinase [Flavobacterium pallidum]AWI25555.1 anhydro-N-acetylmuramic acid kinase [Flavobacterium pallidum]
MKKENYNVIGVMSGTSLDGVDLAHIFFEEEDAKWRFEILECETVAYDCAWVSRLKAAVDFNTSELENLNRDYTGLLGKIISDFISKNKLTPNAVCSHGHTILHQPQNGFTLQIGNLPEIAAVCGQKVICDFRVQDVRLGGQGAPLVPIGDRILFSDYDYCLNLGGFSNVSFEENGKRIAFDISPVNTVLNFYANRFGKDFDDRGKISASGEIDEDLLEALNNLDFYKKAYPKSLGFEYVKQTVIPLIESFPISDENKMRTFSEHIAFQIASALPQKNGKLLITGGGAYNDFLVKRMQYFLPEMQIIIPDKKTLEFKEALIFALLGILKLRGEINVLSSVTGAAHDHCSGVVFS